jgi:hypothetical protein
MRFPLPMRVACIAGRGSLRFDCFSRRSVRLGVALVAILMIGGNSAHAQNNKAAQGANFQVVQGAPYNLTGNGIRIGILDDGGANNANWGISTGGAGGGNNLGARLIAQNNFGQQVPGGGPTGAAPNATGADHASLTADTAAGSINAGFLGVATGSNVYFGGLSLTGGDTDAQIYNAYRTATDWMFRNQSVPLFNISYRIDLAFNNNNGVNNSAMYSDWFINTRDTLIVKSAGNNGPPAGGSSDGTSQITTPGDFFNGITVGATDANFNARAQFSSYRLQGDGSGSIDVRSKPDIVAPGTGIGDNRSYGATVQNGTSFAAPHVAGAAAILMQNGLGLPGPASRNHLAVKALLLNGARKRNIVQPINNFTTATDYAGAGATNAEASDGDYLNGNVLRNGNTAGAPKTGNWTPSDWSYNGSVFTTIRPLDDEQGAGLLDVERSIYNMNAGEQAPGSVKPVGWNRNAILSAAGSVMNYALNTALKAGDFITATLCWDRLINENNATAALINNAVDSSDTYSVNSLPDLDLNILYQGNLIASSLSIVENVEHLHIPVPSDGAPGDYVIQVYRTSGNTLTDYGLAWWTVPEPGTMSIVLIVMSFSALRRRRAA